MLGRPYSIVISMVQGTWLEGVGELAGRIRRRSMNLLGRELCLNPERSAVPGSVEILGACPRSMHFVAKLAI